ncbi:MAG TPA: hypothetical protein VGL55_11850 [Steroidobacteraceae bacterium]|jgi:hypothetical protein
MERRGTLPVKTLWPLAATQDLADAVYLAKDGQTNPVDSAQASPAPPVSAA